MALRGFFTSLKTRRDSSRISCSRRYSCSSSSEMKLRSGRAIFSSGGVAEEEGGCLRRDGEDGGEDEEDERESERELVVVMSDVSRAL